MSSSPRTTRSPLRAIDRLKKAANLDATKKYVELSDGTTFEMWVTPLTMAERERAQKGPRGDDANEFALRLLIAKACDENGERLFQSVHPSLKPISIEIVEELDETERCSGGFGSTGK